MSALPLRRYRVLATETRTLQTFVEATCAARAQAEAAELWDETGDEAFRIKECRFDVVLVDCSDA
jgi:hypothetical protein